MHDNFATKVRRFNLVWTLFVLMFMVLALLEYQSVLIVPTVVFIIWAFALGSWHVWAYFNIQCPKCSKKLYFTITNSPFSSTPNFCPKCGCTLLNNVH
jgi:hypothetical protein